MSDDNLDVSAVESPEAPALPSVVRGPRPFTVTLLALAVVAISLLNLVRFGLVLRYWSFIDEQTRVSPWYLALSGLVWGLACLPLAWGLLRGKAWAPGLLRATALTYAVYYWMDQVFLQDHPLTSAPGGARLLLPGNWVFEAGLTVLLLAFMMWSLGRQPARAFFGESNEHQPENETLA